jgi:hypothetical protein
LLGRRYDGIREPTESGVHAVYPLPARGQPPTQLETRDDAVSRCASEHRSSTAVANGGKTREVERVGADDER